MAVIKSALPVCTWEVTLPFSPSAPKLGKVELTPLQFDGAHTDEFEVWIMLQGLPWLRRQIWALPRDKREETVRRLVARAGVLEFRAEHSRYSLEAKVGSKTLVVRAFDRGRDRTCAVPMERLPYTVIGKESEQPDAKYARLTEEEFKLVHQACLCARTIGLRRKPEVCLVKDADRKIQQRNAEALEEG